MIEIDWPDVTTLGRGAFPELKKLNDLVRQSGEALEATLYPQRQNARGPGRLTGRTPPVKSNRNRPEAQNNGAGRLFGSEGSVKPAPFAYVRAASLDQVFELLARYGDEARVLAGGQSLIASLNLRLSAPAVLIDINGLSDLAGIAVENGALRIGALTRQRALGESAEIASDAPLLEMAMPYIAHPAVRNRGTIGGSMAFADPAAELPACAVALGAKIELRGPEGLRHVEAAQFFHGLYSTDLRPGEVVTAVTIPTCAGYRSAIGELARRHGDYAIVGLAAHARVDGRTLGDARLVFFGVGAKPVQAHGAGAALEGRVVDDSSIAAAKAALAGDLDPIGDLHASAATKLHLAGVLTGRVLRQLAAEVR
jgi:aerobic carbon-monoxide dehydrogenase medium subunit